MGICVSAQQNRVFRQKKSANSHFSAKKDGAKPDTIFCKRHRSKKITALTTLAVRGLEDLFSSVLEMFLQLTLCRQEFG
jgi:hypothetical protein